MLSLIRNFKRAYKFERQAVVQEQWGQSLPLPVLEFQQKVERALVVARLESYDVLGIEMPELQCKWEGCEMLVSSHKGVGGYCVRLQANGKTHRQMHIEKVRETNPEFLKHSPTTARKISAGVKRQKHERKSTTPRPLPEIHRKERVGVVFEGKDLNGDEPFEIHSDDVDRPVESSSTIAVREPQKEMVVHPDHYGGDDVYEVLKVLEAWWPEGVPFNLGNAVKYIARAGKKNPETYAEDLKKGLYYLAREISLAEGVVFHVQADQVRPAG